jgi:transcription antitermination protein NusB
VTNLQQPKTRRVLREKVMQALYAHEVSKDPVAHIIANVFEDVAASSPDRVFAERLFTLTVEHQAAIDTIIKKRAANWELDRIALIDRLLLRMGICEMQYFDDIPPKVTINEAIEIAKRYSTEKSGNFINGILDHILQDMKADGTLNKSGRGLLSEPTTQKKRDRKP